MLADISGRVSRSIVKLKYSMSMFVSYNKRGREAFDFRLLYERGSLKGPYIRFILYYRLWAGSEWSSSRTMLMNI